MKKCLDFAENSAIIWVKGGTMKNYSRQSKVCGWCGKEYQGLATQKYCSNECAYNKHYSAKKKINGGRMTKTCKNCGKEFQGIHNQHLCSKECKKEYLGVHRQLPNLSSGTVGAIQELRVSVDLLSKGFDVFRSLSPACSCDLLAKKNNKYYGIEVRTAYKNKADRLIYTECNIRAKYLALALPDTIIYKPEII